jgi:hypothetical protein
MHQTLIKLSSKSLDPRKILGRRCDQQSSS